MPPTTAPRRARGGESRRSRSVPVAVQALDLAEALSRRQRLAPLVHPEARCAQLTEVLGRTCLLLKKFPFTTSPTPPAALHYCSSNRANSRSSFNIFALLLLQRLRLQLLLTQFPLPFLYLYPQLEVPLPLATTPAPRLPHYCF